MHLQIRRQTTELERTRDVGASATAARICGSQHDLMNASNAGLQAWGAPAHLLKSEGGTGAQFPECNESSAPGVLEMCRRPRRRRKTFNLTGKRRQVG